MKEWGFPLQNSLLCIANQWISSAVEYKLIEPKRESIVVVDLDIKRKGITIPASGPKMSVVQKYVYENGKWIANFKSV